MILLDDIRTYLIAQGVEDLYIGESPQDEENSMWLVADPSPAPNPSIGYYEQLLSVWGKFRDTSAGITALEQIFDELHREVAWQTDNHYIYLSAATSLIEDFDRDIEGRKLLRLGLRFIYRKRED